MEEKINKAIEHCTNEIEHQPAGDAMKLSQAIVNLMHAKRLLKDIEKPYKPSKQESL